MLNLPAAALIERIVPKTKFYERVQIAVNVRNEFTNVIGRITWRYKIAQSTINIAPSVAVQEIQVFIIELKQRQIPHKALAVIDKAIPYPILFVLSHGEEACYVMQHKLDGARRYYRTEWGNTPKLLFDGTSLEAIYQRLIASFILDDSAQGVDTVSEENFEHIVAADTERVQLEKQIAVLENKVRNEQQFNKKVQLNMRLQELRKQLED